MKNSWKLFFIQFSHVFLEIFTLGCTFDDMFGESSMVAYCYGCSIRKPSFGQALLRYI